MAEVPDNWSAGRPAQNYPPFESSPTLNNVNDCISVWRTVLESGGPSIASDNSQDLDADYQGSNRCMYKLSANPLLSISYDSNSVAVVIDNNEQT